MNRMFEARIRNRLAVGCLIMLLLVPSFAWVFPEHRDIATLAIQKLNSGQQQRLQELWSAARSGHEGRLCENVTDTADSPKPTCVDYAAWTAIGGDHSCSARDMLNTALNAPWILGVEGVSNRLKKQLAAARRQDQRINAVRGSDLALQRTDPEYVTRASSNNAHFLLAKPDVAMDSLAYARLALGSHAELNALATYLWYHLRALTTATEAARSDLNAESHSQIVRSALADEAFGLHFLEDSFAAGHVAGNWGSTAVRLGTHNYYNQHGVSLVSWSGHAFVAVGDAYLRPEDAERAATAVHDSLVQLLDAFGGKMAVNVGAAASTEPDAFDVCHTARFSAASGATDDIRAVAPIVEQTPVPALGAGLGELPRFRAELGPFVGLSTGVRFGVLTRGFGPTQTDVSTTGSLDAAVRVGIGLEGVLNESSDGLAFAEFGVREDKHASGVATLPSRGATTARVRVPFWLVPGDLLVAAPILAFTSPRSLQKMAVGAANGGLIPWQAGLATRIGRFQFVLGREVGLSFYNNDSQHPVLIPTPNVPPINVTIVTLKSFQVEFPILEYRIFRTFSLNQSSGLIVQPYVGFDTPTKTSVVSPEGAPSPRLHTIVTAGVRVVFDWRRYVK
jgi:hypothetical protein